MGGKMRHRRHGPSVGTVEDDFDPSTDANENVPSESKFDRFLASCFHGEPNIKRNSLSRSFSSDLIRASVRVGDPHLDGVRSVEVLFPPQRRRTASQRLREIKQLDTVSDTDTEEDDIDVTEREDAKSIAWRQEALLSIPWMIARGLLLLTAALFVATLMVVVLSLLSSLAPISHSINVWNAGVCPSLRRHWWPLITDPEWPHPQYPVTKPLQQQLIHIFATSSAARRDLQDIYEIAGPQLGGKSFAAREACRYVSENTKRLGGSHILYVDVSAAPSPAQALADALRMPGSVASANEKTMKWPSVLRWKPETPSVLDEDQVISYVNQVLSAWHDRYPYVHPIIIFDQIDDACMHGKQLHSLLHAMHRFSQRFPLSSFWIHSGLCQLHGTEAWLQGTSKHERHIREMKSFYDTLEKHAYATIDSEDLDESVVSALIAPLGMPLVLEHQVKQLVGGRIGLLEQVLSLWNASATVDTFSARLDKLVEQSLHPMLYPLPESSREAGKPSIKSTEPSAYRGTADQQRLAFLDDERSKLPRTICFWRLAELLLDAPGQTISLNNAVMASECYSDQVMDELFLSGLLWPKKLVSNSVTFYSPLVYQAAKKHIGPLPRTEFHEALGRLERIQQQSLAAPPCD